MRWCSNLASLDSRSVDPLFPSKMTSILDIPSPEMVSFPRLSLFSVKIIAKKGLTPFRLRYIGLEVTFINNSPTNNPWLLFWSIKVATPKKHLTLSKETSWNFGKTCCCTPDSRLELKSQIDLSLKMLPLPAFELAAKRGIYFFGTYDFEQTHRDTELSN